MTDIHRPAGAGLFKNEVVKVERIAFQVFDSQFFDPTRPFTNQFQGLDSLRLPAFERLGRWVDAYSFTVQMEHISPGIQLAGTVDHPAGLFERGMARRTIVSQAQVERQVDGKGQVVGGGESLQFGNLFGGRQVARAVVHFEQDQLHILHLPGQIVDVGQDVGRDDIGTGAKAKRVSFHRTPNDPLSPLRSRNFKSFFRAFRVLRGFKNAP